MAAFFVLQAQSVVLTIDRKDHSCETSLFNGPDAGEYLPQQSWSGLQPVWTNDTYSHLLGSVTHLVPLTICDPSHGILREVAPL